MQRSLKIDYCTASLKLFSFCAGSEISVLRLPGSTESQRAIWTMLSQSEDVSY